MFNSTGNYSLSDIAAATGNGYNRDGFFGGDGGSWWFIVLFILICFGGGWNNGGWNNSNGVLPFMATNDVTSDLQSSFDQLATMNGINGLTAAVTNGFADAEVARCNSQANLLQTMNNNQQILAQTLNANQMGLYQTLNGNQSNLTNQLNTIAMNQQNCCCENRAAVADLKYTVATENCADRAVISDGLRDVITNATANTQAILDKLCAMEIDGLKQRNADLLADNNALKFAQSQTAQTADIAASQAAQTAQIIHAVNPTPIPAYVVANPNSCNCGNYYGYGYAGCGA